MMGNTGLSYRSTGGFAVAVVFTAPYERCRYFHPAKAVRLSQCPFCQARTE